MRVRSLLVHELTLRRLPRQAAWCTHATPPDSSQRHGQRCRVLAEASPPSVRQISASVAPPMLLAGATTGPLLDGIHGNVALLTYTLWPVDLSFPVGPYQFMLHTAYTVPLLLGVFYAIVGSMYVAADQLLQRQDAATAVATGRASAGWTALTAGGVAALLQLSAVLYDSGTDYATIATALAVLGILQWRLLDGTAQGLALGVMCAVGAPLAEVVLMSWWGLWEYPKGDLFGAIPSWVPCCYFFYTALVGNYARWVWSSTQQQQG